MQPTHQESPFDPGAWADVQDHLRLLVQKFDGRGLLDPTRPDEEAFPAMEKAAKEDVDIASSLATMAGRPWLYLFVTGPPSADEERRAERWRALEEELLPGDPGPADEVHAIVRGLEVHPKSDHQPDPQKVERVRKFIESQALMDPSDDSQLMTQLLEGLDSYLGSGVGSGEAPTVSKRRG